MDKLNSIDGVIISPLKIIENPLGNVFHGMKSSDLGFMGFNEAYFSTINHNQVKPWKKHLKMTLNLIVPVGEIRFILYDERKNSDSYRKFLDITLSKKNYQRLTVPPNVWVSFKGVGNALNLLLNVANLNHDPNEVIRQKMDTFKFNWDS
jgi:dTDP-4-dehydrorhamnose 3,5-epimerase